MDDIVKQIYYKMLIKPNPRAWPYQPITADAISLLECLINVDLDLPKIWWIDPRPGTYT